MKLLITLALLLPAFALADDQAGDDMRLTVKPVLCITDNRNPSCHMSFLIVWQSGDAGYYCLFNDFTEAPVRCWSEELTARLSEDHVVRENFSYYMTGNDPGSRLAEVMVEVLHLDSDDRRRKRRTRHVWDIN